MSDQDTDERSDTQELDTEESTEAEGQDTDERSGDEEPDEDSAEVSSSGVELEGYESKNIGSEERAVISKADSPDDVDDDLISEIEKERERRLDPDNRPPNTEVDNTQRTFLTEEARFEDSDIDQAPSLGQGDTDEGDSGDDEKKDDGQDDRGTDDQGGDDDGGATAEETGTRSEDDAGQGAGEQEAAPDPGQASSGGKHKA